MANGNDVVSEDLAIQDTLSMTVEERLQLLANLIVDRILLDRRQGESLLFELKEFNRG